MESQRHITHCQEIEGRNYDSQVGKEKLDDISDGWNW